MATSSTRTVVGNAGALLAIQFANQILPFVLVPYLTRVLGVQLYGIVAYGVGIAQLANVLTDYGFALSATLLIAKHRDDVAFVNRVIGAVFVCKALLLLFVTLVVSAYALSTKQYAAHRELILLSLLAVGGMTFQPVWFFQGIEKMGYITVSSVVCRLSYFVLVLGFVSRADDYLYVTYANGASQVLAAALGIVLMVRQGYRPVWPGWARVKEVFHGSTEFFWSRAAVSTYTSGGTVFLGLAANATQVAYYAAADQLYRGAQSLFTPLSQALYPNMARTQNFSLLFRITKWTAMVCALGVPLGALMGQEVLHFLFGPDFVVSLNVLLVFLLTLAMNTPSVLIGYPLLGALGQAKLANRSVLVAGAVQVLLLLGCYMLGLTTALNVAMTVLAVETLVLCLRLRWGIAQYRAWVQSRASATPALATP